MCDRSGGTPSFIARLFGPEGWRRKLSYIRQRAFPPGENMGIQPHKGGVRYRLHLCRLYLLRVVSLWKKHGKTIRQGLRKDPATVRALAQENQRNQLKDWLSRTDS